MSRELSQTPKAVSQREWRKRWTPEQRMRLLAVQRARWLNPEYRRQQTERRRKWEAHKRENDPSFRIKARARVNAHRLRKLSKETPQEKAERLGKERIRGNKRYRENAKYREQLKMITRRNWIRRKYGLSEAQFNEMLAAQGGSCALCGSSSPGAKNGWQIDHDHKTERVRGILCHPCNVALGGYERIADRAGLGLVAAYIHESPQVADMSSMRGG